MTSTVNVPGKCVGDDSYANGWNKCREAYLPLLAGRDARIAELEADRDSHQRCAIHAMTELAAIKAQEPVDIEFRQFMTDVVTGAGLLSCGRQSKGLAAELSANAYKYLLGAPVSEAKAQGVVIPEPLMAAITRADDVLHALSNLESSSVKLEQRHGSEWAKEVDAIRRELHTQLARLNAAPVQQVSVPDGWKLVRNSGSIILKCEGQWSAGFSQYDSSTLSRNLWRLFDAMLAAAQSPGVTGHD